jgi:hypothetical protein
VNPPCQLHHPLTNTNRIEQTNKNCCRPDD